MSDVSGRAGRELGSQNPETVTMISTCGLAELKGLTGAQHFLLLAATALLFNCRITDAGDDAPAVVVKVTEALKVSAQSSLLNMTFDPVFDDDDATLNTLAQAYCLNYTPATSTTQTQTSPNNEGATADTFDYVVESDPKGKYGFIFIPGMGESSNSTVEDGSPNRRFIDGLLERLPGKMIVLQALPDYDKLYFLPRETGDREVLNQGFDPLTCLMREGTCAACHPPEDVNAFWRTGQGASWMNPSDETNGCFEKQTHDSKRWEKVTTSNFDRIKEYVGGFVSEDGIATEDVYIFGFSLGAVMALHSGIELAAATMTTTEQNLAQIGGVVSLDGSNVQNLAVDEKVFENLPVPVKVLYFMFTAFDPIMKLNTPPVCLRSYPNLELQLLSTVEDTTGRTNLGHAAWLPLLEPIETWIKAGEDKGTAREEVESQWIAAHNEICRDQQKGPTPPTCTKLLSEDGSSGAVLGLSLSQALKFVILCYLSVAAY